MTIDRNHYRWILVAMLCIGANLAGATDHSGTIEEDDYWTAAGNPHVIVGTVTVADSVHLLIGPGVEVHATRDCQLRVEGHLTADGDPGNEVRFTRGSGGAQYAISFLSGGSGTLAYCIVEQANTGIYLSSTAGQVTLFGTAVRDCGTGIRADGGALRLQSTTIRDNSSGLVCRNVAPQFLDGYVVVTENSVGIRFYEVPNLNLTTPLTVSNSTSRGIYLQNCSLPTIDNVTLTGNANYGALSFENCGDFMLGAGNVIGGTGQENAWPVTIKLGSYPAAGCVIPASGNENNNIRVDGGVSSVNGTWRKLPGVDYVLTSSEVTVSEGGTLTIEPGVTIRDESAYGSAITIQGTLNANGLPGQEILLSAGNGVTFENGGSGFLSHSIFENAGDCITTLANATGTITITDTEMRDSSNGLRVNGGNVSIGSIAINVSSYGIVCDNVIPEFLDDEVTITGGSRGLSITDVPNLDLTTPIAIAGASQAGVFLINCLDPLIDNLTVTGCAGVSSYGAFYLDRCGTFTLGAGNVIGGAGQENAWPLTIRGGAFPGADCAIPTTGNINDDIRVSGGTSSGNSGTWRKFAGLDYIVTATPTVSAGDTLIIDPGVHARFDSATYTSEGLRIQGNLIANGEPGQEIEFTRNSVNNWDGIGFLLGGSGELSHCVFEHAGGSVELAADAGIVTITDSVLRDGGYGIYASGGTIELGSTIISGMSISGMTCSHIAPAFLDDDVVIENCGEGLYLASIADLRLSVPLTVRSSTRTGVYLLDCPDPTLDNLVVTGCSGIRGALWLGRCGEAALGPGNRIGGAGQENSWPVVITAGTYLTTDSIIPDSGNTNNDIKVDGGYSTTSSGTWFEFPDLDYVISSAVQFNEGAVLTIAPGVRVRGMVGSTLSVRGTLSAIGSVDEPIVFTRDTSGWEGLSFYSGGSATLSHCLVEQATNGILLEDTGTVSLADAVVRDCETGVRASEGTVQLGSVLLSGHEYGLHCTGIVPAFLDGAVVVENCATGVYMTGVAGLELDSPLTIRGSTTCGVLVMSCDTPTIDNLILTGNIGADGALLVVDCGEFTLGGGNVIGGAGQENSWPLSITAGAYPAVDCVIPVAGNVNDGIRVKVGSSARSGTWRRFEDLDYTIATTTRVQANTTLTIEPGVTVRGAVSTSRIYVDGTLDALGTPEQPITFTGLGDSGWSGLDVASSGDGDLIHCFIEHATNGIYQHGTGTVSLADCTVRDGSTGIRAISGTVALERTLVTGNNEYGIYLDGGGTAVFGSGPDEWNEILDNGAGRAGRALRNGANDIAAPYVWWGSVDPEQIAWSIYDADDNASFGMVEFTPYCNAEHEAVAVSSVGTGDSSAGIPARFALAQGVPNPFNPTTLIRFDTTRPSNVRLTIHDLAGRTVATLIDGPLAAGRHQRTWSGCDDSGRSLPSGVYFCRIESAEGIMTRKLALVR